MPIALCTGSTNGGAWFMCLRLGRSQPCIAVQGVEGDLATDGPTPSQLPDTGLLWERNPLSSDPVTTRHRTEPDRNR